MPQHLAFVHIVFNNPNTPPCALQVPVPGTGSTWAAVVAYLEANGVEHSALDYVFALAAVRTLTVGGITTLY